MSSSNSVTSSSLRGETTKIDVGSISVNATKWTNGAYSIDISSGGQKLTTAPWVTADPTLFLNLADAVKMAMAELLPSPPLVDTKH